jgi:rubrerythrin
MVGAIVKRDVLTHPVVTIQAFGWIVFLRAVFASREQTFLGLLTIESGSTHRTLPVCELIDRCIQLELRAKNAYLQLAKRFADDSKAMRFFTAMAAQEQSHSDLLEICREASKRAEWVMHREEEWAHAITQLERETSRLSREIETVQTLDEAMRIVIALEGSEINSIFSNIMDSLDSGFVRKLEPFATAIRCHIEYIDRMIPTLVPSMEDACQRLRQRVMPV